MILDDFGLLPAVEFLRKGVTGRTGMPILVESNIRSRLATTVETALYRITYEALRMATQGRARSVRLAFLREESRVECSIRVEGGDGAQREAATVAIRQRIDDLSGTVLTCVTPTGNFVIVVGIPTE
jgi:signal transduction histidine kinase